MKQAICHENSDTQSLALYLKKINDFNQTLMSKTDEKSLLQEVQILEEMSKTYSSDQDIYDFLMQSLSIKYSILGDYTNALKYNRRTKDYELPKSYKTEGFHPVNAIEIISEKAIDSDIVVINEAHHMSKHRTLTYNLLDRLWDKGYRYFAVEGLTENGENLIFEQYISKHSGYYTNEPIFANLLIHAKNMGFKIISYDYYSNSTNGNIKDRDSFAAETINKKIFQLNKTAKVLIHVGYSHAKKNSRWLAGILTQSLNKKILSIDQTAEVNSSLVSKNREVGTPIIYTSSDKSLWSLNEDDYDITVVWPTTIYENNRPIWQKLNRLTHTVNTNFCNNNYPCVVEIFQKHHPDAVPLDRVVINSPEDITDIFLHPGINTMIFSKVNGSKVTKKEIICNLGLCF